MSVIATINVGGNGATSKHGSSRDLSTPADRNRFLALHRSAGSYIVGGRSFAAESYINSTAPIYLLTRNPRGGLTSHLHDGVTEVDTSVGLATVMRALRATAQEPIIVEAGVGLLLPLIEAGTIEELHLSISPIAGDGDYVEIERLISSFELIGEEVVESTRLLKYRYNGDTAYS